jgi:hypothetical protein
MALPVSLGVVTLTGTYVKPDGSDGSPDAGSITIRSDTVMTSAGGVTVGPFFFKAELVDGAFVIPNVPVTNDPDWTPSGWTYLVKESLGGSTRSFYVAVPNTAAGTTVSLSSLAPVIDNPDPVTYVLTSTGNEPNGYAKLDEDGVLDPSVLPGGSVETVSWASVTDKPSTFPPATHNHDDRYYTESEVDTLLDGLGGGGGAVAWTDVTDKPSTFPPSTHTHSQSDVTGLATALSDKSNVGHGHAQADVTGLVTALSGKASSVHTHSQSEVTGLPAVVTAVDAKAIAPAASTDNTIARWDGTNNKTLQGSGISITDANAVLLPAVATQAHTPGLLYYNTDEQALEFHNSFTSVRHQVGMEDWVLVRNETGVTIADGKAVYITGSSTGTGIPLIALARADDPATTVAVGITTMAIPNNSNGVITTDGVVHTDTSALTAGGSVFVSAANAGELVQTAPTSPNYRMRLGIVGRSHASLGTIIVTPTAAALGNGTANQFLSLHPSSGRQQWKTVQGTTGKVTVTHGDGTTTISTPASGVAPTIGSLVDAATIATDASTASHFRCTLGGNRTLGTPTNPADGQRVVWEFVQDATGGRTITLNASFVNFTGTTITLPTGANKRAYMGAVYKASTSTWDVIAFAVQP